MHQLTRIALTPVHHDSGEEHRKSDFSSRVNGSSCSPSREEALMPILIRLSGNIKQTGESFHVSLEVATSPAAGGNARRKTSSSRKSRWCRPQHRKRDTSSHKRSRDSAEDGTTPGLEGRRRVVSAGSLDASSEDKRQRRKVVTQTPLGGSSPDFRESAGTNVLHVGHLPAHKGPAGGDVVSRLNPAISRHFSEGTHPSYLFYLSQLS